MADNGWLRFGALGDEWFRTYLRFTNQSFNDAHSVWFFIGAHTLELYLKSAFAKAYGMERARDMRHNIFELWSECAQQEGFPFTVQISKRFVDEKRAFSGIDEGLSVQDQLHITSHQSLYRAVGHSVDLKYLGTGGRTMPNQFAYAFNFPDDYMIFLLAKLREWIGLRGSETGESLDALVAASMHPGTEEFISNLLSG